MVNVYLRPEFTCELIQGIPYVKWLHDHNQLDTVYTSVGMKPYYFFTDRVVEKFNSRTVDNKKSGVLQLPNTWLHHNCMSVFGKDYSKISEEEQIQANGVLDYSKWTPPDYSSKFSGDSLKFDKKVIVINNQYNFEKGMFPTRYFNIECLYNMFNLLCDAGYTVVYTHPKNTEFVNDENELATLTAKLKLTDKVDGIGEISDYELCEYYDDVLLFDDVLNETYYTYNEFQLRLFDRASGFIGLVGGAGALSCFFKKPTILYATVSAAIKDGYWKPNSYYQKLSDQNAYPVVDKRVDQIARGSHDYSKIYELIEQLFL